MNHADAAGIHDPRILADAFSEFISASATLEASYRELQREVGQLGIELAERNAALTRSLAENDRMRAVLQQTIDSMPCGVMVLNAAEALLTINPEGKRLLGPEFAGARTLADLSRLAGIDFKAALGNSGGEQSAEICMASHTGKRWLAVGRRDLQGAPGSAESGHADEALQSIWILRDITDAKRAEQEREGARRAMALAEISTVLAHEIRNPLASLELFASLLTEDGTGNAQWIANLRAGIRTLSGTVNNVLSLNGESPLRLVPVDLSACAGGAVEFVHPIAEQAGVRLSVEPADAPLMIDGNEDGIRQIILNLVSNAIRHTPAGGAVVVTTREEQRGEQPRALLEVRDTGCGIPDDLTGRIFDAGFSGTGETPGLGLAVCRRLARHHRGTIRVLSRTGCGSTFQVEFPVL